MFCAHCGHQNPSGAGFCSSCGSRLTTGSDPTAILPVVGTDPVDDGEDASTVLEPHAGVAELVVRRGPDVGARFPLEAEVTRVGRHPESDILLDDVTVSRRHAEFSRQGDRVVVRDVGSLNGTYVNRERIEETSLDDDDEVQIGKFKLQFRSGEAIGSA